MPYDYSKLLGAIKEKRLSQVELAEKIGMNPATLNRKLSNESQFKQKEMQQIMTVLDLSQDNITHYFFAH